VSSARESSPIVSDGAVSDEELLGQVLEGGLPGEHAGLELLLRRRPPCWNDAVLALTSTGVASPSALDALENAWRTYLRIEPTQPGSGK
jgi:hypothetical protein